MLEKRVKRYLDDIIEVAFEDVEPTKRERFHWFRLYFRTNEYKTKNGHYIYETHTIEIFNPRRGEEDTVKTCLHEVAHHIDYCMHGTSGHQKPFYDIYERLIYASLDMGIFTKENFLDSSSRDRNKVEKILLAYRKKEVNYQKPILYLVQVWNSYSIKDGLKNQGYSFNKISQAWEREVDDNDLPLEESALQAIGAKKKTDNPDDKKPYYTVCDSALLTNTVYYLKATGDTYVHKEELKDHGFYFNKDHKLWVKKLPGAKHNTELTELNRIFLPKGVKIEWWNRK